jgi:hypothetical protein
VLRSLLVLVVGAVLGALVFHLYYLHLAPAERCGWDHPLADEARSSCRDASAIPAGFHGYEKRARHDLDDLVGKVSH